MRVRKLNKDCDFYKLSTLNVSTLAGHYSTMSHLYL